jgi:hypothetical protein
MAKRLIAGRSIFGSGLRSPPLTLPRHGELRRRQEAFDYFFFAWAASASSARSSSRRIASPFFMRLR